ncbi:MAG: tetraacyldisaccharide 4'-kinase [Candidatus Muproteobacteria bacterium RBG_16_62_13]|uniref:Tetraacyldisaccharide 4'-kinase n=1 Tax=Candidatus Muproteobacteria bacterium RBG_16_62_13 TaxID=1817756 RepID=A0A1F6T4L6_9PROT|nr:MAG: tetraacyldisaccharide 4'-kinase [Candidatus Muproteobacteria bacterium RBG_16_62_13]
MSLLNRLADSWYRPGTVTWLLLPFSGLYCLLVGIRRQLYRVSILRRQHVPAPVIVVGNITVGGSGKTPLVIWLALHLRSLGYRPGVVTRGYGGRSKSWPRLVTTDTGPADVGDEPVLIARHAGCPVMADPDRVRAARALLAQHQCDLILSDDGLQHYRLARDIEIAVIDGERRFGNGFCLPAGPLREPISRLKRADLTVTLGAARPGEYRMDLTETGYRAVEGGALKPLDAFRGQSVHAVAGIGNPGRFFAHLRKLGVQPIEHPLPDHHEYREADLRFGDNLPVIMTEKDAVKCSSFSGPLWYLAVESKPDVDFASALSARLKEVKRG